MLSVDFTRFVLGYRLSHTLTHMRDLEYNFRLAPDESLAEEHATSFNTFLEYLTQLTDLEARSGNEADLKAPKGILEQIHAYREAFVATVVAWQKKGLDADSGLRNQLVEDIKQAEQTIEALVALGKTDLVGNLWHEFYRVRSHENAYLKTSNPDDVKQIAQLVDAMRDRLDDRTGADERAVVEALGRYRDGFLAVVEQDRVIKTRSSEMEEANESIEFLVEYHFGRVMQDMREAAEQTRLFSEERTRLAFIMATILILLMLGVALLLVGGVVRPLAKVMAAMQHVADGNLDSRVPVIGQDELAQMANIFNQMARQLLIAHNGLQTEQEKLMTILLSAREGIVGTNRDGRVVLVNPAALRLLGKTEEEIVQAGFHHLLDDPNYVEQFLVRSGIDMPEVVVYKDKVLNFFAASIEDKKGEPVGSAALIRDVTEEKKLERMLRDLSNTDGLTQLLNRRRFDELMQIEFQRARRYGLPLGLLLFDVDHFKKFNDTYGHDQGDRVLQFLARTMKASFRDVDFCCRYGGEEFCIITPNTPVPGLQIAAERFRERVEASVIDGLKVTVSIGAVAYPLHIPKANGPADIFKAADDALYTAKRAGRNRVCLAGTKEAGVEPAPPRV